MRTASLPTPLRVDAKDPSKTKGLLEPKLPFLQHGSLAYVLTIRISKGIEPDQHAKVLCNFMWLRRLDVATSGVRWFQSPYRRSGALSPKVDVQALIGSMIYLDH